jgi:hypothetical protein
VGDRKEGRGKSGSRYSAGGGAAVEEQRYPEVAPAAEAPSLTEARRALAEGRGTAERLMLAETMRAIRRERDPDTRREMLQQAREAARRIRPGLPKPEPSVMKAIASAFDRLDRGNNTVSLLALRRALSGYSRPRVDAAIRELQLRDRFTLDSHEGRHRTLTKEELRAGIRGGRTSNNAPLVYISRRED